MIINKIKIPNVNVAIDVNDARIPALTNNSGKVLAVNSGATGMEWVNQSGGGISGTGVTAIVALTESEYAALVTKDSTTLYIVTPDPPPVTNYLRLSSDAITIVGGTITEVGSGYDISDLTNNPPVLYDGNGDVVSVSLWGIESVPGEGTKLKYMTDDGWRYITTAATPQTYGL